MHKATEFRLEARPQLPEALHRLGELANDLFYSWNYGVRGLFARIDLRLWQKVEHNPKLFLRRVSQHRLEEVAADRAFLAEYRRVLSSYDAYVEAGPGAEVGSCSTPKPAWWPIFAPSSGFTKAFRSIPVACASWPVTTARRPAISACPLWPSGYCTSRAISCRPLMPRASK